MNNNTEKRSLRINFILPPTRLSGGPLAILEYANRLIARGHKVTVTTFPTPMWPPQWDRKARPFPWYDFKGEFAYTRVSDREWKKQQKADEAFLARGGREEHKKNMGLFAALNEITVFNYLVGCMPDCDVNIATLWTTAYAAYFSKKGKPVYFMQHYEEVFSPVDDSMLLMRLGARQSYQLPIYKVANSSWLQKMIEEKCGQTVPFSNNAIELADFAPRPKRSALDGILRVVTFSRPEEWKGFADTAAAMARIRKEYGDRVEWHVFGAAHNDIRPDNAFAPYVFHVGLPFPELAKLYAECDVAVCGSWYESFPLPPLEAMASGTAVVTTLAGMEDYCFDGKNCLAVQERDVDSFAAAIRRLLEDPALRARLATEGLRTAAGYGWDKAVERREQMLFDIVDGKVGYNVETPLRIGLKDGNGTPFEEMPRELAERYHDGDLVEYAGMVFLVRGGCLHHIATPEILGVLAAKHCAPVQQIDALSFARIPRGLPIRTLSDI